jgi:L-serine/L-threonine ammonia-lyase
VLGQGMSDEEWGKKNVVIVLCGGSNVTLGMLNEYRDKYRGESSIKI